MAGGRGIAFRVATITPAPVARLDNFPPNAKTPLERGVFVSLTQTEQRNHLRFTAPPFVILYVLEQVSHNAVLPMPETECFHTRSFQISPHGTSITGPPIGDCLQGNVSSADRLALRLRQFGRLRPCQLITHGYFCLLRSQRLTALIIFDHHLDLRRSPHNRS
jgi:hypothetical protein